MEIKLDELKQILCDKTKAAKTNGVIETPAGEMFIVIADRGFVWAGLTTVEGDFCRIDSAKNIRTWGTTKGLGELRDGPKETTKLDDVGSVLVPMRAVMGFIKCNRIW